MSFSPMMEEGDILYRNAFENAAVGIAYISPEGQWLRMNKRVAEMFGYTPAELEALRFQDITHPEDLDTNLDFLKEVREGRREGYKLEKRYFHKAGHIVWVNLSVSCIRDTEGKVRYFISVLDDITEQKRVRQALDESEARFRGYQQTSPDGFMLLHSLRDQANEIVDFVWDFVNPAGEMISRQSKADLIGARLLEVMPSNRSLGLFDAYKKVVETGETWQGEISYPRQTHGIVWLRITAAKVDDGFAVSFQDITEHKDAEIRLRESQDRQRRILDNVVALVGLLRPDGTVLESNKPSLMAGGLQRQDVVGKKFWECAWWSYDPDVQASIRDAVMRAAAGEQMRFDVEICGADGKRIPVDFQLAPCFDEAGRVTEIIPSGIDITERKLAESQREMLVRELSHRVKNSLAMVQAIASHTMHVESSIEAFRESFSGRLRAIAACHDLLIATTRSSANVAQLVSEQVSPYTSPQAERVTMSGPPIILGPEASYAFGLILHELATNAVKYGAWSNETGSVSVSWSAKLGKDGRTEVIVDWRERGGPKASPPERKGFGSVLIEESLSHSLGGQAHIEYAEEGLNARFQFPVEGVA
ncbi:PAS domain S-box protein [Hyphomonas beringensis]|nr:PAS domain S-box protein [Hyphomonas beringensis]